MNNIFMWFADKFEALDISGFVSRLNVFSDVNLFHVLYDWLPGDIAGVCAAVVTFSFIMFVVVLIKKVIAL